MSDNNDSNSNNEKKMEGHDYDGIQELDNSLPKWWVNLFYGTIFFSAGYFLYYVLLDGPGLMKEYEIEKKVQEIALLSQIGNEKPITEVELREILKSPDRIKQGKDIFQVRCASCHGEQGQGGIGPNLTDDYWIHGGKMVAIAQTITKGVSDKGMPPWGPVLKKEEIHSLTAYIKSIRGTNPPNAKAPQGILENE